MPVLVLYFIKVSVCISAVYGFYYLALRNLTFYTWNRWYLLLGTGLSFLIPFAKGLPLLESREANQLNILYVFPRLEILTNQGATAALETNSVATYISQMLPVIFTLGLVFGLINIIGQFVSFFRLRQTATCWQEGQIKIYQVNKNIAPFSFGNAIYLNKSLLPPAELQEIIRHEMVHIRQKHTLDVLWMEVMSLLNWCNPFVWLLKQAVRENLEFLADRAVLAASETDKKYYQYLMLKIIGLPGFSLANQFNISSLKTRIIMMNKTPSTRPELFKFLFALPLMALLVLACRDNDGATPPLARAGANQTDLKAEVPPPPPPPAPELPSPPPPEVIKSTPELESFMQRNPQVDLLGWQGGNIMVVFLKAGEREEYNLNNKASKAAAEKKYGKLPPGPPPPPPARNTSSGKNKPTTQIAKGLVKVNFDVKEGLADKYDLIRPPVIKK